MTPRDTDTPTVSIVLMCFNQAAFVEAAIAGALAQDYPALQVVVSDDCSTDSTADVARRTLERYAGPHAVVFNRNERNLGIGAHANRLFELSTGSLVVFCGGDDISHPSRVSALVEAWRSSDFRADAIYCGARKIDRDGTVVGAVETEIAHRQGPARHLIEFKHMNRMLAVGACGAYSRRVMEFGRLADELPIEDIPLLLRAAMRGGIRYVDVPLVDYRTNVSVWREIRRGGDTFQKRQQRRDFYTLARWRVALQVMRDAIVDGSPENIRAATRAFQLHDFVRRTCENQHMSYRDFLGTVVATGHWRYPFVAGFLDGHPRIHRTLLKAKHIVFGNND